MRKQRVLTNHDMQSSALPSSLTALTRELLTQAIGGAGIGRPPEQPHPSPGMTDSGSSPPTTGK
jgi:hypothetical protein